MRPVYYNCTASTTMKTGVLGTGTPTNKERLLAAYAAYNPQDGAALLALVSEDVDWPDGSARLDGKAELERMDIQNLEALPRQNHFLLCQTNLHQKPNCSVPPTRLSTRAILMLHLLS